MENIGNKLFDNDLKINESKSRLGKLHGITDDINDKKSEIEKKIHMDIFKYNTRDILNLMMTSESTIDQLYNTVSNVYIYTIRRILDDVFVIRYSLNDVDYEFHIINNGKRFNPFVTISENGIQKQTYDMKLEFIALDFEKIKMDKILENYIDLLMKKRKK